MRLSVVRPIETRKFIAVSRQYLHNEEEAIDMWKSVVNSINLSEKQKLDIVRWKQLFMQKVEPIVDERKKLNVQIQAHLPQVCSAACRFLRHYRSTLEAPIVTAVGQAHHVCKLGSAAVCPTSWYENGLLAQLSHTYTWVYASCIWT